MKRKRTTINQTQGEVFKLRSYLTEMVIYSLHKRYEINPCEVFKTKAYLRNQRLEQRENEQTKTDYLFNKLSDLEKVVKKEELKK